MSQLPNDGSGSEILLDNIAKAKRQQVATACQQCRRKKVKCDGQRPCGDCTRRNLQCQYTSQENETPQQALKRKHDDLSRIYEGLASQDEEQARETLRRIRAGHQVESILRHVDQSEEPAEQRNRRQFLLKLVQSDAPIDQIVKIAASLLLRAHGRLKLPPFAAYEPLRDTMVKIGDLSDIVNAGPSRGIQYAIADGTHDGPVFWVPASPWTGITQNEEAVSHLVSLYFCFINPYWRFVEEDAFLRAIRLRRPSPYCSPLLVNAMLCCASLYSEINEAFATPGKMLTRGDHFFREAMRLWEMEEGQKATITNVQASLLLSYHAALRGRDKLGVELVRRAAALVQNLPLPETGVDPVTYTLAARTRSCLIAAVVWYNFVYGHALGLDAEKVPVNATDAAFDLWDVLPDTIVYWTGFPLSRKPLPLNINRLLYERSKLIAIMADLIRSHPAPWTRGEILAQSRSISLSLRDWHDALPIELHYAREMPAPLYEFHAQYTDLNLGVYTRALLRLSASTNDDDSDESDESDDYTLLETLRANSTTWAHRAAKMARDYREVYGYKIVPPFLVQAVTFASFALLRVMKQPLSTASLDSTQSSSDAYEEIEESFKECFRCLLGAGLQGMHARGVARMIYCTAIELKIKLPDAVQEMIHVVAETAWQPSDLHQLNSIYPNWATADRPKGNLEYMEDMLRKWEQLGVEDQSLIADAGASAA